MLSEVLSITLPLTTAILGATWVLRGLIDRIDMKVGVLTERVAGLSKSVDKLTAKPERAARTRTR